jgi:hypothetical protein
MFFFFFFFFFININLLFLLLLTFSCERIVMLLACLSSNFMRTSLSVTTLIKFLPTCQYLPNYYGLPTMPKYVGNYLLVCFVLSFILYVLLLLT